MFAVKILVIETKKTIIIFTYPIEYSGRFLLKLPVIINIITPGNAIKKPKTAEESKFGKRVFLKIKILILTFQFKIRKIIL